MASTESIQHVLDRVRPPRGQITYDVEIGGAIEMKELPFVGGILSDLSGQPVEPLPPLKERKFVEIDRDNFDEVLAANTPHLDYTVPDRLSDEEGSNLKVELDFENIEDFDPLNVINQVEALRKLFEARGRLNDLLAKLDGNDVLDELLQSVLENTDQLKEVQDQVVEARPEEAEGEAEEEEEA